MSYQLKFTDLKRFPADIITVSDNFFNGPVDPTNPAYYQSPTGSANDAKTTLTLAGRGVVDYGLPIQQGLVYMLEHFANYRSPVLAQPGQIWYKTRQRDETPGNEEALIATDPAAVGLYIYRASQQPGGLNPGVWDPIAVSGYMHQDFNVSGPDAAGVTQYYKVTGLADATDPRDAISQQAGDIRYLNAALDDIKSSNLTIASGYYLVVEEPPRASPLGDSDATNKLYVDTKIQTEVTAAVAALASSLGSVYVSKSGDLMTGTLALQSGDVDIQTGNLMMPIGDLSMGIGDITLTSGSIVMPAGGSITIGVGNLTVTAGTSTFGGPSSFIGPVSMTSGLTLTGTAMNVVGTAVTLSSGSTLSGISTPTQPTDAVNKAYVDTIASALGADGVVTGGNINSITGVITLNRTIGGDVTLAGAAAPFTHTHTAGQVFYNANPPTLNSFVRDQFINQPIWPNNVTLESALNVIDDAMSETLRPYSRQIIPSDGVTATYPLDREIRAGFNQLQVYVDGVKWICDDYGQAFFQASPELAISADTGLSNSTAYSFNLTVDGTLYPDVTITTPASNPVSFYVLATLIDAELVAQSIPAVCVLVGSQIRIYSLLAGAGSAVAVAPPSTGTYLVTSITSTTVTVLSTSITTSYGYYEVGVPGQLTDQFTFNTVPPAGTVIELLMLTR